MRSRLLALCFLLIGCSPSQLWTRSTIAYDDTQQFGVMDLYRPLGSAGPLPTVVFIHGGAFVSGSRRDGEPFADTLCRSGFAVVALDYRLTRPGALWPLPLEDVRKALRYLRAHATDLGIARTGVMGSSAGGCLAAFLHLQEDPIDHQRPECLVDLSGEVDLLRLPPNQVMAGYDAILAHLYGHSAPFSTTEREQLSPATLARRDSHVLIAHSTHDSDVFVAQADSFAASLSIAGADFLYLRREGWAHGDDLWQKDPGVRSAVTAFLLDRLR